ncbi:heparinase II/III domain-containing protein [Vibrio aphrogenes]|uniref:heparinase II/III domain-containing protein n=1 Tax=Vibrio aphrogenes TaxID=1891186 RepID=UPI000B3528C5|nr:heparinase II/III family protein [Vibrio aphrogenes]
MLTLNRTHDFQVFTTPKNQAVSPTNPPRFNWPQADYHAVYTVELYSATQDKTWTWHNANSPFQLPFTLLSGHYQWRLIDIEGDASEWMHFDINEQSVPYLPPRAKQLFELCQDRSQWLMYFDEDISTLRISSWSAHNKLKATSELVDIEAITYPAHYRRGQEEGKRTAITHVREWIDRDLISLTLLYKIWNDQEAGQKAVEILCRLAEWSPEGPASLLRPCAWGDEVGLSLSRNLYLAYHWLTPLLTSDEQDFIRPMLIRIAHQMETRLEQDQFKQFPGHSHTSRLPAYLGIAALALFKEYDQTICERWLNYALTIYQCVLPFYGGEDGSWAEGPFYSSSYTKWQHPFFLAVERISDFSFYEHPFYKNYYKFAMDFVVPNHTVHPFGDGFWCQRTGKEWPGFFAQNPLRIYADRFGDLRARETANQLEMDIETYYLHLLDIIPTRKQHFFLSQCAHKEALTPQPIYHQYYDFAGLGKASKHDLNLYFRASQFGNSSHRHADQGNLALIYKNDNVLIPSGSYGYRFGSLHHAQWTRTTRAHNLPLIDQQGQKLDTEDAVATLISQQAGEHWYAAQIDLTQAYASLKRFIRTVIMIENYGVIMLDHIECYQAQSVQWRLHSECQPKIAVQHTLLQGKQSDYQLTLHTQKDLVPTIVHGYQQEATSQNAVISDATDDIYHLEWDLASQAKHLIAASCVMAPITQQQEGDCLQFTTQDNVFRFNQQDLSLTVSENTLVEA